jgi:hypothetical protein
MTPTFQVGGEDGWILQAFQPNHIIFAKGDSIVSFCKTVGKHVDAFVPSGPSGLLVYPVKNPHELLVYDNATLLALLSERGLKLKEA